MHYYPFYSPFAPALVTALIPIIAVVAIWTIAIKGYALWHAARNGQKEWFIALLVVNTLGILDVIYVVWFRINSTHHHSRHLHTPKDASSSQA